MDGEEVEKRLAYELEVNVRATFPQLISEDYDNGRVWYHHQHQQPILNA